MVDGSFHLDDLLGPLLLFDVVGPQGDKDWAAQRPEQRCGDHRVTGDTAQEL